MSMSEQDEDRLLSLFERELVAQSRPPTLHALRKEDLEALGKQLRRLRDRYRRIANRQQREMRGKAEPKGATAARDNTGSEAKLVVLVAALNRVSAALRLRNRRAATQVLRDALAAKQAAQPNHPGPGRTAAPDKQKKTGMQKKESPRRTVRVDPREIGRVSQATKAHQAKKDR